MPRLEELIDQNQMRRAAEGAALFEPHAFMERMIKMRATRPKSFAGLSLAVKLTLGHYEIAKRRAEMLAADGTVAQLMEVLNV